MQTLEQRRAASAIVEIRQLQAQAYGHYVSYVSALPAQIVSNGLGQAMATLLASAGRKPDPYSDPHYLLCRQIACWLMSVIDDLASEQDDPALVVLERLALLEDQRIYFHAQAEALAYLQWLKKIARAMLQDENRNDPPHGLGESD